MFLRHSETRKGEAPPGPRGGFTLPETLKGFRSTFNTMSMSLHLPLSSSQRHTCCKNVQASLTTPVLHSSQFMPETPAGYSTPCKPYTALQFQHACSGRISTPSCTMLHHGVAWHARFALLSQLPAASWPTHESGSWSPCAGCITWAAR